MLEIWKLAENPLLAHVFSWLVKNAACWMFVICSLRYSLKRYFLMRCWPSLITVLIMGSLPMGCCWEPCGESQLLLYSTRIVQERITGLQVSCFWESHYVLLCCHTKHGGRWSWEFHPSEIITLGQQNIEWYLSSVWTDLLTNEVCTKTTIRIWSLKMRIPVSGKKWS